MKKKEVIKKAWGKHWQQVKKFVNDEGYVYLSSGTLSSGKNGDIFYDNGDYDSFDTLDGIGFNGESIGACQFRPISLIGIETNNGWIKIESEADLPKESGNVWFILKDGHGFSGIYASDFKMFKSHNTVLFDVDEVEYYQHIVKPELPLY